MKLKISLLLLTATFLALAAGYASFVWLRSVQGELHATRAKLEAFGDLSEVTVPLRDIEAGEVLSVDQFTTLRMPSRYIPTETMNALPALQEGEVLRALMPLREGQIMGRHGLGVAPLEGAAIASLAPGRNAAAFDVTNLNAMRSQLVVGALVDLYAHDKTESSSQMRLIPGRFEVQALPPVNTGATSQAPAQTVPTQIILAGAPADIGRALLTQQDATLHLALSSGQTVPAGPEIIVRSSDAQNPTVINSTTSAPTVEVMRPVAVPESGGFSALQVPMMGGSSEPKREVCNTAVIRAGTRVLVEVPCQ